MPLLTLRKAVHPVDGKHVVYTTSRPEGRAMMLLHGLGGSHSHFRPLLERPPEGFRTIAVDLPGFGRSFRSPTFLSPEVMAEYLELVVAEEGLENIVLVGHSFGGQAALALAERSSKVGSLILASPSGLMMPVNPITPPKITLVSRALVWLISTDYVGEQVFRNLGSRPERLPRQTRRDIKVAFRQADALSRLRTIPYDPAFLRRVEALPVPAGTLWAELDTLFPYREAVRLIGHLPHRVIADMGHAWPMEDSALFESSLLDLLSDLELQQEKAR